MVLGRYLPLHAERRRVLIALGVVMVAGTYLANHLFADTPLRARLFATDPFSRSLNYTISAARLVDRRVLRDRLDRQRDEVEPW